MFDYDRSAPLDARLLHARARGEARVEDLSYASPSDGERVTSYLVVPPAPGRYPALLFSHWGFGSRETFLSEAIAYARAGVVSLLPDAPGMGRRGGRLPPLHDAEIARTFVRQAVVELRRGADLLESRPEADPDRLGFVGHGLGASLGGQLAAAEPRVRACVLMAGCAELSRGWKREPDEDYGEALRPLDAARHVGRAKASFFFQYGTRDGFVPKEDAEAYFEAAPEPKRLQWYEANHAFGTPALRDRAAWLAGELGFALASDPAWLARVRLPIAERVRYRAGKTIYSALRFFTAAR